MPARSLTKAVMLPITSIPRPMSPKAKAPTTPSPKIPVITVVRY